MARVLAACRAAQAALRARVVCTRWFEAFVVAIVLANCVCLALDNPLATSGTRYDILRLLDTVRLVRLGGGSMSCMG